jgi:hypothetical protein
MKKALFLVPVCAVVALACNKTESTATSGASTTSTTTATTAAATTTAATPGIVDKALSFIGAGPFEGAITMNNTSGEHPAKTINYEVKGTKMRFESPEERGPMAGSYVIFDTTAKKMTMVDDTKKTAMVMDMGAMGGMTPGGPAMPAGPKPNVEKTGKTDTVAGYSCDIWKMTEPSGEKTEACVAKGITFPAMGRRAAGWMSSLEDAFPLRAISYDPAGKEKSRMEVTKIEKKSLDDAHFQVPAGYTTQDMASMMKGMGMGGFRPPR